MALRQRNHRSTHIHLNVVSFLRLLRLGQSIIASFTTLLIYTAGRAVGARAAAVNMAVRIHISLKQVHLGLRHLFSSVAVYLDRLALRLLHRRVLIQVVAAAA